VVYWINLLLGVTCCKIDDADFANTVVFNQKLWLFMVHFHCSHNHHSVNRNANKCSLVFRVLQWLPCIHHDHQIANEVKIILVTKKVQGLSDTKYFERFHIDEH